MKYSHRFRILVWVLVAITTAGISFWLVARGSQNTARDKPGRPIPYEIIKDDMGTIIRIGIQPDVNEEQLRATLAQAANDHQDDSARDYLTSMYLRVEAYLVREGHQSSIAAGRLQRYVPPGNPAARRKMTADRTKDDSFALNLDEAKRTLQ